MGGINDCDEVTYSKVPSLWGEKGIQPMGIRQHMVGDCWFLAALGAIAEKPERIQRLFWNQEYDKKGAFRVYFWLNGDW